MSESFKADIKCRGRNKLGEKVLTTPASATVEIRVSNTLRDVESDISLNVNCPHNTGGHGQLCRASGERDATCVFSIDLPWAFDNRRQE